MPGSSPPSTRRARGSGSWSRCAATPRTFRAARRRKASTWVSWRGRSISCSAATRAPISATASCASIPGCRLDSLSFSMQFRQTPIQVTLTHDQLTLALQAEGGEPFGEGGGPRRCSGAERGGQDRVRAEREPRSNGAFPAPPPLCSGMKGGRVPKFQGAIFDVDGVLVELAARKGVARVTARADGVRLARHPRSDDVVAGRVHAPTSTSPYVSGKPPASPAPCRPRLLPTCPTPSNRVTMRSVSRRWSCTSSRPAISPRIQTRCVSSSRSRMPGCASRTRRRRRTRGCSCARSGLTRSRPGRGSPRRHCRPGQTLLDYFDVDVSGRRFRPRQAGSRDFPDRSARTRRRAAPRDGDRGRVLRRPGREGRRHGRDRHLPGLMTLTCWQQQAPIWWSPRSMT